MPSITINNPELNTHEPSVSVIVAVYNQERFIGRCLRSLLDQTMPHSDYEIIVINDGSDDRTQYALELFCDPFDSIVKVITNKKNLGLPAAINQGIKASSAPYVVRVDSDDFVNINFLNFLHFYLEVNEFADAIAEEQRLVNAEKDEREANSYRQLIQQRLSENWNRPPSARRGMETMIRLQLVPTGRVVGVTVLKSSGDSAFDRSVEQAAFKADQFIELQKMSPSLFEKKFRQVDVLLSPKDLRL